jgi:hypothetical protein
MELNRWNIDLVEIPNALSVELSVEIIDDFIHYMSKSEMHTNIQLNQNTGTFIENFLTNIALFHINRLNLDINKVNVSCWAAESEYRLGYTNMHTDGCDYENIFFKTYTRKPIITCLTFFNDNYTAPFIYTNLRSTSSRDIEIAEYNANNNIHIELPQILKHISFDGGNITHGEIYIKSPIQSMRTKKKIAISIWSKDNSPINIPTFDVEQFAYHVWKEKHKKVDTIKLKTDEPCLNFIPHTNIKTITLSDDSIINYNFFENLIKKKNVNACYDLLNLLTPYLVTHTSFIIDISTVMFWKPMPITPVFKNGLEIWEFDNGNHYNIKEFNNGNISYNTEIILNLSTDVYSDIEKYIYDISRFHLSRSGCYSSNVTKNIIISYIIINNDTDKYPPVNVNNSSSLFSIHTNLNADNHNTLFTNLNNYDICYDTLHNANNTMYIYNNNQLNRHIIYTNKFYNKYSNDSLIINIRNGYSELNSVNFIHNVPEPSDRLFKRVQSIPETVTINKDVMYAILKDPDFLIQKVPNYTDYAILKMDTDLIYSGIHSKLLCNRFKFDVDEFKNQ